MNNELSEGTGPARKVRREPTLRRRPEGVRDETVTAVGKVTEAFEWLERARGSLYEFHQTMGKVDFLMSDAADLLRGAGHETEAEWIVDEVVGRNVLDGRWTFQIVEEFDDCYYQHVQLVECTIRELLMGGGRHVYEAEMKERRRTAGRPGHESVPAATHDARQGME